MAASTLEAPAAAAPASAGRTIGDLVTSRASVPADMAVGAVVKLFEREPELDSLAVIGSSVRFLSRARFFLQLGKRFGYSLFENRPVELLAEEGSVVTAVADPVEVISVATQREAARIHDDLVVVDEAGTYVGLVSMRSLLAHNKDLLVSSMTEMAQLEQRNRELADLHRLQSEFVQNVTHELRSPLNGILGLTSVLLAESLEEAPRSNVERIAGRARALLAVINNILDLSKLEAGRLQPVLEEIEVAALAEELRQGTEPLLVGRPVRFLLNLKGAPRLVVTDPHFVQRIGANLLGNAAKFTELGSIVLEFEGQREHWALRVRDTGPGIAADDLSRLFTRFAQLESARTKRHAGTGLGLAIVQGLVEQLGGAIAVESQLGEGSTFTVRLPVRTTR